ncbi:MAG: hypothetical protein AAF191_02300 [Verrucomicrobiota bacterium]
MELSVQYLQQFLRALGDSEYLYLFLEPILTVGLLSALLTYLFGILIQEPKTQVLGLMGIIAASLSIAPYLSQRNAASDRIENVYSMSQPDRTYGFRYMTEQRSQKRTLYYLTTLCATLTILFGQSENRMRVTLGVVTTLLTLTTVSVGFLAHYEESKVYHPHLRSELRRPDLSPVPAETSDGLRGF